MPSSAIEGLEFDPNKHKPILEKLDPNKPFDELDAFIDFMNRGIIGQPDAVYSLAESFLLAQSKIRWTTGPIATYFFLGPTGVGKTEAVKLLSQKIYGPAAGAGSYVRINCNEYQHNHEIAKLIGAPPGYIGHSNIENAIFHPERLRQYHISRQPGTAGQIVILFDEIEKANRTLLDLILQLTDEGFISTSDNQLVDLRNSFIIFTSNLGAEEFDRIFTQKGIGFHTNRIENQYLKNSKIHEKFYNVAEQVLKKRFSPEFFGRIDKLVVFRRLDSPALKTILDNKIEDFLKIIYENKESRFNLFLTEEAKDYIINFKYDPDKGARHLQYALTTLLIKPLSHLLLTKQIKFNQTVIVDFNETCNGLEFLQERLLQFSFSKVDHLNSNGLERVRDN